MRRRLHRLRAILCAVVFLGVVLAGRVAAAEGAPPTPAALTLEAAADLALDAGPEVRNLQLLAVRAKAGADLAGSAFRWRLEAGTARIPQLMSLADQFGGALGDLQARLGQLSLPPDERQIVTPTLTTPALTGLVHDPATGHRWAVLPALAATRTFRSGGQLLLSTHWGVYGPLNGDSAQADPEAKWQPFAKMPVAQFSQPLFRDPSTLEPFMRQDEAARNVARDQANAILTKTKTLLDLAQAYFGVARAKDEAESAVRALRQAKTEAQVRQDKAWKGDATGLDLMEGDVLVQRLTARVESARHAHDVAGRRLNRMLGRPLDAPLALSPPQAPPNAAGSGLNEAVAEALAGRQEIALAESAVESAKAQAMAARESTNPQVSALANLATDKSWSVGLDVQWPLRDGGSGAARVEQASANLALAEQALTDRQEEITLQVTQAYYDRLDAARAWEVAELATQRAERAVKLTRERLERGAAVAREVSAAEDTLFDAEAAQRSALYRLYQAEWALLAALGGLSGALVR